MKRKNYRNEEAYRRGKVLERARYYDSTPKYPRRIWSPEDKLFLVHNNDTMTARQLAVYLQRSVKAIEHARRRLKNEGLLPST